MTTSTTDAEAIARIVSPDSWKIRDRHVAGANSDPGLTETERANALASAECYVQESLRRATAIISYLASRREAQEPVDWIYEDELPSSYPYGRMFAYSKVRDGVRMFPVYAPQAAPAPAGEVERLRGALENTKSAILRADPEILTDTLWMPDDLSRGETVVDHIDAALNGGRA